MTENVQTPHNGGTGSIFLGVSIFLLFFHFYRFCPGLFVDLISEKGVVHKIISGFSGGQFFENIVASKLAALGLLAVYLLTGMGRNQKRPSWRPALYCILAGLALYFGSIILIDPEQPGRELSVDWAYLATCLTGYFLALSGMTRLFVSLGKLGENDDIFNRNGTGFPQEQKLIETDYSINLRARYFWKGRWRNSWINIINPRRGIAILGSPGSGKSWFVIESAIRQLIEKGFAMFVYDFKYDSLSVLAYNHFLKFRDRYPENTEFYTINFDDLSRSNRCNCIDPLTLDDISDAVGVSRAILLSMNKSWIGRQGDYWVEAPMNFLAAIVWFLRQYEGGCYCTLPHAIELIHQPYEPLFAVLSTLPDIEILINPFKQALENKNVELVDGQLSSVKMPLGRLASPNLYYVLSGNDFLLDINNPRAPKIFCLGGSAQKPEALAPVLSLYIDRMCKLINRKGNYRSAVICDEFSTVRAVSMLTIIATGRSNDIIPVIAFQDFSQLKMFYSQQEADALANMTGNSFCGQVNGDSAKMMSERFQKILQKQTSWSYNGRDTSVSESEHLGSAILPATLSNLSAGEFVGIAADDPDTPIELKAFHARIFNNGKALNKERKSWQELPVIRKVDRDDVLENEKRIKEEIRNLVKKEIGRLSEDPELGGDGILYQ